MSYYDRDRTIHAVRADGGEVVRYDKAGKWYIEWPGDRKRRPLSLQAAANEAVLAHNEQGGRVILGCAGGTMFDARVRQHRDYSSVAHPGDTK